MKVARSQKKTAGKPAAKAALPVQFPVSRSIAQSPRGQSPFAWDFRSIPVSPPKKSAEAEPTRGLETSGRVTDTGDSLEQEARIISQRAVHSGETHPLLREGLARAQFHTGQESARRASAEDALAFTVGRDIWFGSGQYRPDTIAGQQLIAHEAVHVAQQSRSGRQMVQRQQANAGQSSGGVQMPPMQVGGTLNPVETAVPHLDRLRDAGMTPGTPTLQHAQTDIERNTPVATTPLPFTTSGWDATDILNRLGQYDRIAGTDSDAIRCVQAVGMAAHIPDGPLAVTSYLASLVLQGMLAGATDPRKRTAIDVLNYVKSRIDTRRATFGDLSWAQEAMHDLFYDDVSGTPLTDIPGQVAPALDLTKNMQTMDVWCDNPQQVMAQANQLNKGEQLLVNEWTVSLNTAFDQLEDQNIHVPEGQSTTVTANGRQVRIRHIPSGQRPPHTQLDFVRDSRSGHQLLIIKDSATGGLRLYEPEITTSGRHFDGLAADGSNLATYFQDQPNFGIYHYIQIIGKLTPGIAAATPTH
jgi:hypothetical protein